MGPCPPLCCLSLLKMPGGIPPCPHPLGQREREKWESVLSLASTRCPTLGARTPEVTVAEAAGPSTVSVLPKSLSWMDLAPSEHPPKARDDPGAQTPTREGSRRRC